MDFKDRSELLRALGARARTSAARAELVAELESKHEGFRVVATQALCTWADPESLAAVKSAIWSLSALAHRWAAVGAMCRALAPHLKNKDDLDWAIALFSEQSHHDNRFVVTSLFEQFAPKVVLARLRNLKNTANRHNWHRDVQGAISRAEYRARIEA